MIRNCAAVLALLAAGLFASAAGAQTPSQAARIAYPGKTWAVEINSPGLAIQTDERKPDGRVYFFAKEPASGILISVTLEQSKDSADPKSCPGFLQKRIAALSNMNPQDVQTSEIQQMAVAEYLLPTVGGIPLQQKNMFACTTKEDVFIDIHLSKVQFKPADEPLFAALLGKVQISDKKNVVESASAPRPVEPRAAAKQTSWELFSEGSRAFLQSNYRGAIGPYEAALDLEKKQRKLSQNYWRVLVDNLGMAYGISGDLDHAEETFNYGVSQDPGYPMFYYNLGCAYAERNDMDRAMDYLKKAFSLKANSIPGEGMPDPRRDDSFKRFMGNERFRNFVDTLN